MERLEGRRAVVTGGGTGMGRELVRQLAKAGCHVATCDVATEAMAETRSLAEADATGGARVTTFVADVADESQLQAFRGHVESEFGESTLHLLFNNAGIAGGGSFVTDDRAAWEKTFGVDWGGVYLSTRTFLPMILAADEGHIINTSSINGIFASIGPNSPHTSYSAAKFAVRGFSEALIADLRVNAPHVRVSVVCPGHVGTSIVLNSAAAHGQDPDSMTAEDISQIRRRMALAGMPVDEVTDDDLRKGVQMMGEAFRDFAPVSAADAATVILDGVRANEWRILVGDDARAVDAAVRANPEHAYDVEFWNALLERGHFGAFGAASPS
jgi:NAD(P)-dependent dehydrogenase (short-subunit alcohol dehydrogenase family)